VPHIGEHRDQVLAELGYAPEAIRALVDAGVLGGAATGAHLAHA
jgi:crotonobetainyl-CoA:carnitine CoA-transferase CaiB-like acyl-CoA transferase